MLADTSVWIDHLRGVPNRQAEILRSSLNDRLLSVVLGDMILLELLQGVATRNDVEHLRQLTAPLPRAALMSFEIAEAAAAHYRRLRQIGRTPRKIADLIIATWCIANEIPLLHRDRDFDALHDHCGLRVV